MSWSGATFTRTDGTRTGANTWADAKAAGVKILAADHDTHDQDLADGIQTCLRHDGGNPMTGALDFDGNKLTDAGILNFQASTLTLVSGAATGTLSRHVIAAESGTSDDLDTLTATAYSAGAIVYLIADTGDTIYVTTAGNFNQPCMLDASTPVPFMWNGSAWELLLNGWILLDTKTASASAALDFTKGIDGTYKQLMFRLNTLRPANDGVNLFLRTSNDGGSTFDATANNYHYAYQRALATGSFTDEQSIVATALALGGSASGMGNLAVEGISGHINIFNADVSGRYTDFTFQATYRDQAASVLTALSGGGSHAVAEANDAFRLMFGGGNITSGSAELYGLKVS